MPHVIVKKTVDILSYETIISALNSTVIVTAILVMSIVEYCCCLLSE